MPKLTYFTSKEKIGKCRKNTKSLLLSKYKPYIQNRINRTYVMIDYTIIIPLPLMRFLNGISVRIILYKNIKLIDVPFLF